MHSGGINRTQLDNGLRVVTESLPSLRSATVGFWVNCGSRDETPELAGSSHFLEHLLFKGTEKRSAREITQAIESVGGDTNAFTGQEYTAYYIRVPSDDVELALDILSDIIWEPAFRSDEVESERQVILEEIRMRDDMPDDAVHELFTMAMFPEHPLGKPVSGTHESIKAVSREAIANYHSEYYVPENIVVAAAGGIEHEAITKGIQARMRAKEVAPPERALKTPIPGRPLVVEHRDTEQAHVVLGRPGLVREDPNRHALSVLNHVVGGGMSSRLFEEVREKRGLAYSVYSYRSGYEETGTFGVYVGTGPDRVHEALDVVFSELEKIVSDGSVKPEELAAAKSYMKGATALGLEGSASRMHRIGRSELIHGEVPSLDEVVARIEAVTPEDISKTIKTIFSGPQTLAVVGPFEESAFADRVA